MSLDKLIFKNKKFGDLLEEIYDNQKKKEKQISTLISELRPLIEDTGDATLIVPLIKEYLEIGVRNDDQLVKLATIVQRIIQSQETGTDSFGISEEEREQLMKEINSIKTIG
jgi:methanogenic corrinoid protein MtbC1